MSTPKQLVVFLHGFGSDGQDLIGLGNQWAKALPTAQFVSPNAPFPTPFGAGYQWFSLQGIDADNRPDRIVAARSAFDASLQAEFNARNIDPARDQVVLVGFSQGSIMALDLLVSGRWPIAGVVAFSGRLSSPQPWQPQPGTPVLLVHGRRDDVIPWQESAEADRLLQAAGLAVDVLFDDTAGHGISVAGSERAQVFIADIFACHIVSRK